MFAISVLAAARPGSSLASGPGRSPHRRPSAGTAAVPALTARVHHGGAGSRSASTYRSPAVEPGVDQDRDTPRELDPLGRRPRTASRSGGPARFCRRAGRPAPPAAGPPFALATPPAGGSASSVPRPGPASPASGALTAAAARRRSSLSSALIRLAPCRGPGCHRTG